MEFDPLFLAPMSDADASSRAVPYHVGRYVIISFCFCGLLSACKPYPAHPTVGTPSEGFTWCEQSVNPERCRLTADRDHFICSKYSGSVYDDCRVRLENRSVLGVPSE